MVTVMAVKKTKRYGKSVPFVLKDLIVYNSIIFEGKGDCAVVNFN